MISFYDYFEENKDDILINYLSHCFYYKEEEEEEEGNINKNHIKNNNIHNNNKIYNKFNYSMLNFYLNKSQLKKGCIIWNGTFSKKEIKNTGYLSQTPVFKYQKYQMNAKHISLFLFYKMIPEKGLIIKTLCKNSSCINPYHLIYNKKRKYPYRENKNKIKKKKKFK